ncbi:BON domain-containing protein [Paraburkholderia caballeronis]|uniref:BON domain-containing protein n=1 Tax=Paraburkholderia caballeronis TaxID=416943 RepID=UPI0010666890|nr:BON domain-containing protein [Paraburkholderia caballeronis]TDV11705.1 osmotically-inducible protein OsmY [Paraburkholderia caballeronis]TDV14786.1 osmotically-inducible protein OsmY [Paraburkholderia caballeronis]TDV23906.1 osmotically-inducible protein OsmY [Paraburkholderia caballeronis]
MKTDLQLKHDVEEELEWEPAVNASNIGVEVTDRVVTLSGHPVSYAEKLAAERAAQRIDGVRAVVVEMAVRLPGHDVRTDEDIANVARSILHWTVGLTENAVHVQVENGHVTLTGEVEWNWQAEMAARSISQLRGVIDVVNRVVVQRTIEPETIGAQIRGAMQRHAAREAKHIGVTVREGTVTLTGTVHSHAERAVARGAAWSAPGVRAVVDDLVVE